MSNPRNDPWLTDLATFAEAFDAHPDIDELHRRGARLVQAHQGSVDLAELAATFEDNPDHRAELIRSAREVLGKPVRTMAQSRRRLIGLYLTTVGLLLVAITPWAWSTATRAVSATTPVEASFLGMDFQMSSEFALVALVILMASLGCFAVLVLTFANRAGHQTLEPGYFWWYLTRPIAAAVVGVLFYMVIAAGYFDQPTDQGRAALVIAAAVGGLAGLFTDKVLQAMSKILGQTPFATTATEKVEETSVQ